MFMINLIDGAHPCRSSDLFAISGSVQAVTRAVVPNANVTVKNESPGPERKIRTNESGYEIFTIVP